MQLNEMIQQHTEKLSPQLQEQVLNFVLFLKHKHEKELLAEQQRKDSDNPAFLCPKK